MEILQAALQEAAAFLLTPDTFYQVLAVGAVAALAAAAAGWFRPRLQGLVSRTTRGTFSNHALRILLVVRFPLVWLALNAVNRWAFSTLGLETRVLDVLAPFLWFLLLYQGSVFFIREFFPDQALVHLLQRSAFTVIFGLLALRYLGLYDEAVAWLGTPFLVFGDLRISVLFLVKLLGALLLFLFLSNYLANLLQNRVLTGMGLEPAVSVAVGKFVKFFLFGLGFFIAVDTVGVDLSALKIFGGALGVGIGFGLQTIASNFISGFILLLDKSIKPGDVISVGDTYGWVQRLAGRYLVVMTRDGVERLIPNSLLMSQEVTNWSHTHRRVRLKLPISVAYGSDLRLVERLLLEVARHHPRVLQDPGPVARLMGFGDNGIHFELRFWITDPEAGINNIRSDLYFGIWDAFEAHAITIPFPQRDLHIRSMPGSVPSPFSGDETMDKEFPKKSHGKEDEYFYRKDQALLRQQRREQQEAEERRKARGMACPKCGSPMGEVDLEGIKIDRCEGCGGVFFDKGELELLRQSREARTDRGFWGELRRLFRT